MADQGVIDRSERTLRPGTAGEVFRAFLGLGLTSFGGPVAHLGYFREAFVTRRGWLDDKAYADVVALCQFLPGPASSQVGMAIGLMRAGYAGAFAAWLGFTAPSAIAMAMFAMGAALLSPAALHGLKIAAVAVVAQAVLGMVRAHAAGARRAGIASGAAALALLVPTAAGQILAMVLAGLVGLAILRPADLPSGARLSVAVPHAVAIGALTLFALLLAGLPLAADATGNAALHLAAIFYRAGALVFGGGHVVLPLLQAELVPAGLVSNDAFLAGYGAAQAVPGPLFTFAAYLGAVVAGPHGGAAGALLCLVAIFLPSALLVVGALPYWARLSHIGTARAALAGINAATVGLLGAALYDPVWTAAIGGRADVALALIAFVALTAWKAPPWLVVIGTGTVASLAALSA